MPDVLLVGAEPLSVDNGPGGVLVLHGFTGTPNSMRPLAVAFADAGWSVELPLLPGHGTAVENLIGETYDSFLDAANVSYGRLSSRGGPVVVAGLSMGGTLALSLALEHDDIAGLIVINPLVVPPAPSFLELLRSGVEGGSETVPSIGSDIAKPGVSGGGYDATPIRPMLSMMEAAGVLAPRLGEIPCPALLFSSSVDHVVPTESSDFLEKKFGGPLERVVLEESFHVATLDFDAEEIERRSLDFLARVRGG